MKKLLLFSIAFCLVAGTAFSQISFGPRLGVNFSKYSQNFKDSDDEDPLKFKTGFTIGGVMDMTILDFLSFQPALQFTKKGTSYNLKELSNEHPNHTYTGYVREKVLYLEIPLNFAYKYEIGPGTAQVFLGPYFAFALTGKQKVDVTTKKLDGTTETEKSDGNIKFKGTVSEGDFDEDDDVADVQKPFDLGISIGIGYQWKSYLVNFGWQKGFINLQPDINGVDYDPKDNKYTNNTFFLTVAWLFGDE